MEKGGKQCWFSALFICWLWSGKLSAQAVWEYAAGRHTNGGLSPNSCSAAK